MDNGAKLIGGLVILFLLQKLGVFSGVSEAVGAQITGGASGGGSGAGTLTPAYAGGGTSPTITGNQYFAPAATIVDYTGAGWEGWAAIYKTGALTLTPEEKALQPNRSNYATIPGTSQKVRLTHDARIQFSEDQQRFTREHLASHGIMFSAPAAKNGIIWQIPG
jgi:hypothetical protein